MKKIDHDKNRKTNDAYWESSRADFFARWRGKRLRRAFRRRYRKELRGFAKKNLYWTGFAIIDMAEIQLRYLREYYGDHYTDWSDEYGDVTKIVKEMDEALPLAEKLADPELEAYQADMRKYPDALFEAKTAADGTVTFPKMTKEIVAQMMAEDIEKQKELRSDVERLMALLGKHLDGWED